MEDWSDSNSNCWWNKAAENLQTNIFLYIVQGLVSLKAVIHWTPQRLNISLNKTLPEFVEVFSFNNILDTTDGYLIDTLGNWMFTLPPPKFGAWFPSFTYGFCHVEHLHM